MSKKNRPLGVDSAVILCNGVFPQGVVPLGILGKSEYILCCDGAVDKLVKHGLKPDFIVGDGDSISEENKRRFADIFMQIPDQETNDQTKAVKYLMSRGVREISILGATGGREDHTLGNISLLIDYRHMGAKVKMYTDFGAFVAAEGCGVFHSRPGQQVSIFSHNATGLSSKGLKYPLHDLTNWWQGTLNEATSDVFSIEAVGEYILFQEY